VAAQREVKHLRERELQLQADLSTASREINKLRTGLKQRLVKELPWPVELRGQRHSSNNNSSILSTSTAPSVTCGVVTAVNAASFMPSSCNSLLSSDHHMSSPVATAAAAALVSNTKDVDTTWHI
jgi:hypothetical protein